MTIFKKNVKRRHFVIFFLTIAVLILAYFLLKPSPDSYSELNPTDQKMFDELTLQYKTFDQSADKLWTSAYQYNKEPLILIRSNKSKYISYYIYLINTSKWVDTKKYKKINFPGNPYLKDVYLAKSLGIESVKYLLPAAFRYTTLQNKEMLAFKFYPELFDKKIIFPDFNYFSLHEAFHLYVQKNWIYDKDGGDYIENYPYNKENFDLLRKEYKLLDEGLEATDTKKLDSIMKQWVEIRDIRFKKWPQLIAEKNSEAIEGTAEYLEHRFSDLTAKDKHFNTNEQGKSFTFSQILELIIQNKAYHQNLTKRTSYDKGAALGYILDKLDSSWKQKIEDSPKHRGLTQYDILRSRYFK